MMDNKLSELSKPVAWIIGEESIEDFKRGYETFVVRGDDVDSTEETMKLYSQEYVSALLAELEAKDTPKDIRVAEIEKRLKQRAEEAESRIAELEAIRVDAAQVFKEIGNELGCNPDNESIMKAIDDLKAIKSAGEKLVRCKGRYHSEQNYRELAALFGVTTPDLPPVDGDSETVIAELRARLATPVRLTDERTLWAGEDDYDTGHVKGWNANRLEQAALLKKQGFTVEGDSE